MKRWWPLLSFVVLGAMAVLIDMLPWVGAPFRWYETLFHEMSHGIASVLTGGEIREVYLDLNGSGYCITAGGWSWLIAFAGYTGAALWGALIISLSFARSPWVLRFLHLGMSVMVVVTVLYARNIETVLILMVLSGIMYGCWYLRERWYSALLLRFIGIYILMSATKSPFYLMHYHDTGDHVALSNATGIPAGVFIGVWVLEAVICAIWVVRQEFKSLRVQSSVDS